MAAQATALLTSLLPVLFLNHGGGPIPLLQDKHPELKKMMDHTEIIAGWKAHAADIKAVLAARGLTAPRAILLVSAHYEVRGGPRVGGAAEPKMFYDYGGFPAESYEVQYPAPGAPDVAQEALAALRDAGFSDAAIEDDRGFDHGVFVPLKFLFPDADIPVVPVSVQASQDPATHIRMGQALQSLRKDCLIIGSGGTAHNFRYRGSSDSATFHAKLDEVISTPGMPWEERVAELSNFLKWPDADSAQARGATEHFMPLLTCIGAAAPATDDGSAGDAPGKLAFRSTKGTVMVDYWLGAAPSDAAHLRRI